MILIFQNTDNTLDFDALGLYLAVASECDWDKRHDNYGYLTKPDDYLAWRWGCNLSTVWRKKTKLKKLGLLSETNSGYLRLKYIEIFDSKIAGKLSKSKFSDSQEFIANVQERIAEMQAFNANSQDNQAQNDYQSSRFPSKKDLGFSDKSSGEPGDLSEGDKEWIDKNVSEKENDEFLNEVWSGYDKWAKDKKF
jgi:hypothetical protein